MFWDVVWSIKKNKQDTIKNIEKIVCSVVFLTSASVQTWYSDMSIFYQTSVFTETDFGLANFFVSKLLYWCQELPGQFEFSLQTSVWKENSDSVLVRVWWDLMYLELSGILQAWKQGSSLTSVKCTAKYVLFIIKM